MGQNDDDDAGVVVTHGEFRKDLVELKNPLSLEIHLDKDGDFEGNLQTKMPKNSDSDLGIRLINLSKFWFFLFLRCSPRMLPSSLAG